MGSSFKIPLYFQRDMGCSFEISVYFQRDIGCSFEISVYFQCALGNRVKIPLYFQRAMGSSLGREAMVMAEVRGPCRQRKGHQHGQHVRWIRFCFLFTAF